MDLDAALDDLERALDGVNPASTSPMNIGYLQVEAAFELLPTATDEQRGRWLTLVKRAHARIIRRSEYLKMNLGASDWMTSLMAVKPEIDVLQRLASGKTTKSRRIPSTNANGRPKKTSDGL